MAFSPFVTYIIDTHFHGRVHSWPYLVSADDGLWGVRMGSGLVPSIWASSPGFHVAVSTQKSLDLNFGIYVHVVELHEAFGRYPLASFTPIDIPIYIGIHMYICMYKGYIQRRT